MAANNTVAVAITTIGTAGRISPLYVPNAHPFQFRVRQMDWMEHSASMAHVIYFMLNRKRGFDSYRWVLSPGGDA